jgi:NAD(P)-dependent dehydrogenase (short-subunit alcohol dehydrogenase family)
LLTTDIDYKGVVYGTQLAIHFMRKNKVPGGRIVATASAAAIYPHETYPEYDGAKAAVLNFVRATGRVLRIVRAVNEFGTTPTEC